MTDPIDIIAGTIAAWESAKFLCRWFSGQLRKDAPKYPPLVGSEWVVDGTLCRVNRVVRDGPLPAQIYLHGENDSMWFWEFRKRARRPTADHMVAQMRGAK